MVNLQYSKETLYKLFGLLCNKCSFPNCKHLVFDIEKNFLCEICHIEGKSPKGPRHNTHQSDLERNGYDNLIVLCKDHHDEIDRDVEKYTAERLKKMKSDHEAKCLEPFTLSDEYIEKIYEKMELVQQNIHFGNGNQFSTFSGDITIRQGLSYKETESLVMTLLENNFPKLVESASEKAIQNVKKFVKTFFENANTSLTLEQQQKFSEPDIQYVLNEAIKANARNDSEELRKNLSELIIKRIQNDNDDAKRIVLNEAIGTIGKLTQNQLKIITLLLLLKYSYTPSVSDEETLQLFLKNSVKPFLDINTSLNDFRHIQYAGCGYHDLAIGLLSVLSRKYPSLFIKDFEPSRVEEFNLSEEVKNKLFYYNKKRKVFRSKINSREELEKFLPTLPITSEQQTHINLIYQSNTVDFGTFTKAIEESCPEGKRLIELLHSALGGYSLTSVGIAIGITYFEQITGIKLDFNSWYDNKFDQKIHHKISPDPKYRPF